MSELSDKRARSLIQQKFLSPEERDALAAHLPGCEGCRQYAQTHVYLSQHLHLQPVRTQPAPEFRAAILQRVRSQNRRNLIMSPIKTAIAFAVLAAVIIVAWLVVRSSAGQPAITQPSAAEPQAVATKAPTRTPRPTLTPLPTRMDPTAVPVLRRLTTPEEIAGIWGYCPATDDCYYYQYMPDGDYRGATQPTRARLEDTPSVTGEFWFEGSRLNLNVTEDTLTDRWSCIGKIGIYEVLLLENGYLRFELIEDECQIRAEDLVEFEHEPVEMAE